MIASPGFLRRQSRKNRDLFSRLRHTGVDQRGFTMAELMVIVVIIAVLVGISVPLYLSNLKRARQVEAPAALTEITRLQETYYSFSGTYGSFLEIGYSPEKKLKYYQAELELIPAGAGTPPGFIATLTGDIDSDPELDIWTITEDGKPVVVQSD